MKSVASTVIAGLMLLGTVAAAYSPKHNTNLMLAFSDGGPAPVCLPSDPGCKPPIPPAAQTSVAALSDGGPAPVCLPSDPGCKPPIPPANQNTTLVAAFSDGGPAPVCLPSDPGCKPPIPPAAR